MKPRRQLSIFARTFALLAAALVLAQGVGVSLLLMRTPIFDTPIHPPEIVALLSTSIPAASADLDVRTQSDAPAAGDGQRRDLWAEQMLARWIGVDRAHVRFYREHDGNERDLPPPHGEATQLQPPDFRGPPPADMAAGAMQGERSAPPMPGPRQDGPPRFAPGVAQLGAFTAAVRQADGQWRVVRAPGRRLSGEFKVQVAVLFGLGLLLMLPLAWWFSRALSAPIRRFSDAADQLGRNPHAPALERSGPAELVQAADSFNAMQSRLNRMVHERTQMVAAIAHDLRTPLARLAFRLEALPDALREKTQGDIDEMKAMIAAALDFIRNDTARGERTRIDFPLLVESAVDDLVDTGAELQMLPGDAVVLDGDPLALRRMVANLLGNALKYGLRARVQVVRDHDQCVLLVDDDGPGIDPAQREHLLLPFVRGESSRNRDTGGIGLGLAVANSVAVAHGGHIQLDNRAEGGLRVSVTLPCHAA